MAAVFDVPTYKNQVINKINSHVCLVAENLGYDLPVIPDYPFLGKFGLDMKRFVARRHPLDCPIRMDCESDRSLVIKGMFDSIKSLSTIKDLHIHGKFGTIMAEILIKREVWTHGSASSQHLLAKAMSGEIIFKPKSACRTRWEKVDTILRSQAPYIAAAADQGQPFVTRMNQVLTDTTAEHSWIQQGKSFAEWCEKLLIQGASITGNIAAQKIRENKVMPEVDEFSVHTTHNITVDQLECVYRVQGVYFILFEGYGFIFDRAHLDHLVKCANRMRDARVAVITRRISGVRSKETSAYTRAYMRIEAEMSARYAAKFPHSNDLVAKSMKAGQSMLLNNFHKQDDFFDTGVEKRMDLLRKGYDERNDGGACWYDFFVELQVTNRELLDLSNSYHMLPPPDVCPYILFCKTVKNMGNSNRVDEAVWREFMGYVQAADVSRANYKAKFQPKVEIDETGDKDKDKETFAAVMKFLSYSNVNASAIAPKELWGKFRLKKHYPYKKVEEIAYLGANDVTHIMPDLEQYDSLQEFSRENTIDKNELLYTLKYGSKLAKLLEPSEVKKLMSEKKYKLPKIADIAAKAENTKDELKARETFSGDDVIREITSAMDQAAISLASDWPSVCLRRNERGFQKTLNSFIKSTRMAEKGQCVFFSADVDGWSPNMSRKHMLEHHQYVLNTTCCDFEFTLEELWDGLHFGINKRGIYTSHPCDSGDLQGWYGTMNSVLHAHVQSYAVRVLKEKGVLTRQGMGQSVVLIDDAVLKVIFPAKMTMPQREAASKVICETLVKTYADLGLKVSIEKTIVSTHMFTFLNRYFSGGSEISLPLKVMMKLSRDTSKRFAMTCDQAEEIFNTGRGALIKGADPHVAYTLCYRNALDIVLQTNPDVSLLEPFELAVTSIAPRELGGWAFPTFMEFCSKESTDAMTRVVALVRSCANTVGPLDSSANINQAKYLASAFLAILPTDFRRPNVWAWLSSPHSVSIRGVHDPTSGLRAILRRAIEKMDICTEVRQALILDSDDRIEEMMWRILFCVEADVAVFEILGGIRPLAAYSNMLKKMLDAEVLSMFVKNTDLTKMKRRMRNADKSGLTSISRRIRTQPNSKTWKDTFIEIRNAPVCKQVYDYRKLFYRFIGVQVVNHSDPDPVEIVCQVDKASEIIMSTFFKPPVATPRDLTREVSQIPGTWNSPGSDYSNMFDGMARVGRRNVPSSRSAFASDDPACKSLPAVVREVARFAALCKYLDDRGLDGSALWSLGMAINGVLDVSMSIIGGMEVSATNSTKRLSKKTKVQTHMVNIYPNSHLCVVFQEADDDKVSRLNRVCHDSGNRYSLLALESLAVTKSLLAFAQQTDIGAPERTVLNLGCKAGTLTQTKNPLFEITDRENLEYLLSDFACLTSESPNKYINWIMESDNFIIASRWDKREEQDGEEREDEPDAEAEPSEDAQDEGPTYMKIMPSKISSISMTSVAVKLNIPRIKVFTNAWKRKRYQGDLTESSKESVSHAVVSKLRQRKDLGTTAMYFLAVAQTFTKLNPTRLEFDLVNLKINDLEDYIRTNGKDALASYRKCKTYVAAQLTVPNKHQVEKLCQSNRFSLSLSSAGPVPEDPYGAAVFIQAANGIYLNPTLYTAAVAGDPIAMSRIHYVASRREHKTAVVRAAYQLSSNSAKAQNSFESYYNHMAAGYAERWVDCDGGRHYEEFFPPVAETVDTILRFRNRRKIEGLKEAVEKRFFTRRPCCFSCKNARPFILECILDAAFAYSLLVPEVVDQDEGVVVDPLKGADAVAHAGIVFDLPQLGELRVDADAIAESRPKTEDDNITLVIHYLGCSFGMPSASRVYDQYIATGEIDPEYLIKAKEFVKNVPISDEDREMYDAITCESEYDIDVE
ncbi:RNA-dependent RNA polymerase [Shahe qinvirus-like virus 1]|uniref:RNA-dependent RNA polymerase n=1 Tax=Shahe qinvirus-like virus 1 TaxID=1923453 RepID=A0A1L3KKY1_9VIRU|nr:RNA-dependent RNA polymerase [Shahe qinvirus-like virus 1]APG78071.1 RNA-dependent RNA polymerase [Shahe qinvirus-like virus 1]